MKVTERLEKLRKIMKDKGIDYYIIPSEDAHQSEYVCEHYRGRHICQVLQGQQELYLSV